MGMTKGVVPRMVKKNPVNREVLTYCAGFDDPCLFDVAKFDGEFWTTNDGYEIMPTHWMPLPLTPEECTRDTSLCTNVTANYPQWIEVVK